MTNCPINAKIFNYVLNFDILHRDCCKI